MGKLNDEFGRAPRGALLCRTVAGSDREVPDGAGSVKVRLHADGTITHSGVQTCDSAWACPYCAPNIASVRADEIAAALRAVDDAGYCAVFFTLTLSHTRGDSLEAVFDAVRDAWAYCWSGRASVAWREGSGQVGIIRTVEVTCGRSGWHPHVHGVIIFDRPTDPDMVRRWLGDRWAAGAARVGRRVSNKKRTDRYGRVRHVGCDVQPVEDPQAVGDYMAKWGVAEELSAAWGKSGGSDGRWSALGLLAEAEAQSGRSTWAERRWCEYERVTAGRSSVRWSRGLRDLLANLPTTSAADAVILGLEVPDEEASRDRCLSTVEAEVEVVGSTWNRLVREGRQHEPGELLREQHWRREWQHLQAFLCRAGP